VSAEAWEAPRARVRMVAMIVDFILVDGVVFEGLKCRGFVRWCVDVKFYKGCGLLNWLVGWLVSRGLSEAGIEAV